MRVAPSFREAPAVDVTPAFTLYDAEPGRFVALLTTFLYPLVRTTITTKGVICATQIVTDVAGVAIDGAPTRWPYPEPMVNLTRIYTRTGDGGTTRLGDLSETSKLDTRLAAYADVDETNAAIGVALATGELEEPVRAVLTHVQNDLFDVGADLSTPIVPDPKYPPLRIEQDYVDRLEAWCDEFNEDLPKLRSFILNGGTPAAAQLHVARTVCRRAERAAWAAWAEHAEVMNKLALLYLNRLSDLLFILARHANKENGDILWIPGGER